MLTLAQVLSALDPGDWMVVLDLQDAYFHIHINTCGSCWAQSISNLLCPLPLSPFSLTSAPRVFTKVMSVVPAPLRRTGVPVFLYLDSLLLKAVPPQAVVTHL